MSTFTINGSPIIDISDTLPAFSASDAGRFLILSTDTSKFYRNNGVAWFQVVFDANTIAAVLSMLILKQSVGSGGGGTVGGTVTVDNFPATQAVSAASLPLPSGAATAANQGRSYVVASDGVLLDLSSLAQNLNYNSDGTVNYVQVVNGADTYRQTLTWVSGQLTAISKWVKQ